MRHLIVLLLAGFVLTGCAQLAEVFTKMSSEGTTANADVEFVMATQSTDGSWTFAVTVRHPDTGWEDYADGWDVVLPDGTVIKANNDDPFTRLLLTPP